MKQIVDRGRGPEIAGTRITVYDVWEYLTAGWHCSAIASLLRISSSEVAAAVEYIEAHKDSVLTDYQRIIDRIGRGNSSELERKFKDSAAKLQAFRDSLRNGWQQEFHAQPTGRQ